MITPQLSVNQWLELPLYVKNRLKEIFSIPKSDGAYVENNVIRSDGHTYEDLSRVSVQAMQEFLQVKDTDFYILLNQVIEKIEQELKDQEEETARLLEEEEEQAQAQYETQVIDAVKNISEMSKNITKKRGRPKKV